MEHKHESDGNGGIKSRANIPECGGRADRHGVATNTTQSFFT